MTAIALFHRSEVCVLAAEIPGARYVSLPSANHLMIEGELAWSLFLEEVGRFLNW